MGSKRWYGLSLRFLLSYFVLLIVPLLLMYFMLYRESTAMLRSEIVSNNMQLLHRIKTNVDKELSDINRLCFQIESHPTTTSDIVTGDPYTGYELVAMLRQMAYINDFIHKRGGLYEGQ